MRPITCLILFFISFCSVSQNKIQTQLELIEKTIISNGIPDYQKLEIDLDNDNDLDYIYLYQCSEPKCIEVYLNVDNNLDKVISEFCYNYFLYQDLKKDLIVKLNHCCGESPFTSTRVFNFNADNIVIKENYVLFNSTYELISPEIYLSSTYIVKVINNNYNVRFSPNIKEYSEDDAMFSCESKTNIIGKLKANSNIKVLAELIKENRTWLFVEIDSASLNTTTCNNPIDYEYDNQKLRGWISNNFVEKVEH
ncbi:hypothetical protein [Olleya sp. Bg11-27]|uniref:hypothetical protein n=1 Tax=Olleya sp. Bg11-27 TaxID=2058135 RepID=UPI000C301130|nr:hypothetical protein [Olleya sp. Bg11-27]AUC75517.1 hypothetical protein CW732_07435 [Olleya sp. Bg11-27]